MVDRHADLIVVGARIHTMSDTRPAPAASVAVGDGVVMRLGTREEVADLIGPDTQVFDVPGSTIVPGRRHRVAPGP